MDLLLLFILFPALVFGKVGWSYYRQAIRHARMAQLAEEFDGEFVKKAPLIGEDDSHMDVTLDGRAITLYPVFESYAKSTKRTVVVTTPLRLDWSLSLSPSLAFLSMAQRAVSRRSVTTGHADFDDNYVLKSSSPARARVLFGSREDLRAPLLAAEFVHADASNNALRLIIDEQFSNIERERVMIRYAPLLAEALERSDNLLEHEGTDGGLSIAEHDDVDGALSPATASGGALSTPDGSPEHP